MADCQCTIIFVVAICIQEECARVLLFRGADKTIRNFINQDAESLANLNGYPRLAEIIQQFNPREVGKHTDDSHVQRPEIVTVIRDHQA